MSNYPDDDYAARLDEQDWADEMADKYDAEYGPDNESVCAQHPDATVTDVQEYTGFAGGKCYAYTLSCGCSALDESDDVRAAE